MKPRHAIPFFLLVIAILVLPLASSVVHAQITPLNWSDSKKDLKPGEYITISVHAEGNGIQGLADAGFKLVDSEGTRYIYGITQDGRDVYVFMEGAGYVLKLDTLWPWEVSKHTYDDEFYVKVYCPGEAPPGQDPVNGYLWFEVRDQDSGTTRYYLAKDPGPGGVVFNVNWFAESSAGLHSTVEFGQPTKYSSCGASYGGNDPSGGESSDNSKQQQFMEHLEKLMEKIGLLGVGVVAVLGLLMVARR